MRSRLFRALAAAALFCLVASPPAAAGTHHATLKIETDTKEGDVTIWDQVNVGPGETHDGDIVAVFSDVRIEGTVTGDVIVVLGDLDLSGTVEGDVESILTHPRITESARIRGEMVNVGWPIDGHVTTAQVGGDRVDISAIRFIPFAGKGGGLWGLLRLWVIIKLMKLAALFLIMLLLAALIPRRLANIAAALPQRWGHALLAGLLACVGTVIASILLAITIIGIPLAVALAAAVLVVKWVGLASVLLLMGHTAGRNLFGRDLPHVPSVLGGFLAYAIICLVPIFGFLFSLALDILAVGLTIVTRFGSELPPRFSAAVAGRPASPAGGMPPAPGVSPGGAPA